GSSPRRRPGGTTPSLLPATPCAGGGAGRTRKVTRAPPSGVAPLGRIRPAMIDGGRVGHRPDSVMLAHRQPSISDRRCRRPPAAYPQDSNGPFTCAGPTHFDGPFLALLR